MPVTKETFYQIIRDTWASTLDFPIDLPASPEFTTNGALTVCVRISGAWNGEVRLDCPLPLARSIAASIFQVDADRAENEEILDALSELIHIVGGNLKALLPQPVTLSLPSSIDPTNRADAMMRWPEVCRLSLMSEGQAFAVTLLGNLPRNGVDQFTLDSDYRPPAESPRP
jgi:hypothetical protein